MGDRSGSAGEGQRNRGGSLGAAGRCLAGDHRADLQVVTQIAKLGDRGIAGPGGRWLLRLARSRPVRGSIGVVG